LLPPPASPKWTSRQSNRKVHLAKERPRRSSPLGAPNGKARRHGRRAFNLRAQHFRADRLPAATRRFTIALRHHCGRNRRGGYWWNRLRPVDSSSCAKPSLFCNRRSTCWIGPPLRRTSAPMWILRSISCGRSSTARRRGARCRQCSTAPGASKHSAPSQHPFCLPVNDW
jgi:hypothetical protein